MTAKATNSRTCTARACWKTRHQHEAAADAAEQQEHDQDGLRRREHQEMVPSELICTPRAISTWLSTGSVANSRSVTMRT